MRIALPTGECRGSRYGEAVNVESENTYNHGHTHGDYLGVETNRVLVALNSLSRHSKFQVLVTGMMKSLQHHHLVSSAVRRVKGSEGHLQSAVKLLCGNAGTNYYSLRGRRIESPM